MRFDEYMASRGLNDGEMAAVIDCDRSYVLKLRSGAAKPSAALMATIAEKTEGAVLPNDFFDLPDQADAA